VREQIARVAATDATVLIVGENWNWQGARSQGNSSEQSQSTETFDCSQLCGFH
jgi:hypothetical protein